MNTKTEIKNWESGESIDVLRSILREEINISIYNRGIDQMKMEINHLSREGVQLRLSGNIGSIIQSIKKEIDPVKYPLIIKDIEGLMNQFVKISDVTDLRLFLSTVNTNMCRRFHTDINDLRLLCTYKGPGTLWLPEENVDRTALDTKGDNGTIVKDENGVQQAKTGSVIILKGAIYPLAGTKAIVHRSPTIEESGEERLLLRIDTNDFLNF